MSHIHTHSPLNGQVGLSQCLVAHLSQLLVTMATKLLDLSGDKLAEFIESLKLGLLRGTHIMDHVDHLIRELVLKGVCVCGGGGGGDTL